ncbi:MAG: DUF167 domain-containing protein [Candidatus Omnitrophica bacterium]|nr:DUF167 domain-containing protein [Candidatus Omnitrophota bacterium]
MPVIKVKVMPRAKREKVEKTDEGFKVYVKEPAREGKANKRLVEILSTHLKVKKRCLRILRGEKSREKTVEVTL